MEVTAQQLKGFDGSDPSKPIYIAIWGTIYDITSDKGFYGPGGSYAVFSSWEVSWALAKMSKSEEDVCGNLDGHSDKEMGILQDWEKKFQAKYPVVSHLAS
ncbi:probable steroid-binding protein 3 [Phoenix dactylifera]|uniref:Probable steroid-binding protein 3 n=1 Tax=Phoenix dactylifera TaxID=42345 RepID=A0A8B7BJV9_PHODC|nr:probable steroid-binding protein 3 [Phoenix dactylifera]